MEELEIKEYIECTNCGTIFKERICIKHMLKTGKCLECKTHKLHLVRVNVKSNKKEIKRIVLDEPPKYGKMVYG
ncbi:MAG: hypothetical protein ACTSQY_00910 [Candidatus Odinarchaeia archaeon]